MTKTNLKSFMAVFMGKLIPCFRPPTDDPKNAKLLIEAYFDGMSEFDAETLEEAAGRILKTRKDPFFPTLAECMDVCRSIRAAKLDREQSKKYFDDARARMAADGWDFIPGDQ